VSSFLQPLKKIFRKVGDFFRYCFRKRGHVIDKYTFRMLQTVRGKKYPSFKQIFHAKKVLNPMERKILLGAFGLFLVSLVFVGFRFVKSNRTYVPKVGGSFTEAIVGTPQFINPLFANELDKDIISLVYSGLVRFGENRVIEPDLAEKWEISEDQKTYTFYLRKDVKWHDGETFDAYDVSYTFEMMQNSLVNSPLYLTFQGVQVEIVDDYTLRFILQEPFSSFLSSLTTGILPEHIWSGIEPERMRLAQLNLQPIGTGPFRFSKLKKNDDGYILSYTLARNEAFYLRPAYIEEIVFQFYTEYDDAVQAIREQKVDTLHFVPHDLRSKVERKHILLHTLSLPQYTALYFRMENVLLKDETMREALSLAIDKNRIMRGAIGDDGEVIASPILPGFPGYDAELNKQDYSVDKANELLDKKWERISSDDYRASLKTKRLLDWQKTYEESNPKPGAEDTSSTEQYNLAFESAKKTAEEELGKAIEGELKEGQTFYRKDKEGNVLTLRLVTGDTQEYRQAGEIIAGLWQDLGVHIQLEFIPLKTIARDTIKKKSYDVLMYRMFLGGDPDQYPFWHSSQINYPGLNLSGYVNKSVDKILDSIRTEKDEAKQVELYKQLQTQLLKDKPALFLYMPTYTYVTTDEVYGLKFEKINYPYERFLHIRDWYLKTDGQWDFKKSE